MRFTHVACFCLMTTGLLVAAEPNTLSPVEKSAGFELLFNGTDLTGWQHAGNWGVTEGVVERRGPGGNLTYRVKRVPDDFEIRFEWKVAAHSNSGIYYRPGQYEYQILDNVGHSNGTNPRTCAASLYFCVAPSRDVTNPVGEWNTGRIVCQGTIIQHWLNGEKVIDMDYSDAKWKPHVELLSKRGADLSSRGAFLFLQDHGDPVWFRSIRMRELKPGEDIGHSEVIPQEVPEQERIAEEIKGQKIFESLQKQK